MSLGITTIALVIVATGVVYWSSKKERQFDYGMHTVEIEKLITLLENEPCDRDKIVKLTDLMGQAGDLRGALNRAYGFIERCGEHLRLRWVTHWGHKQLSEHDLAAREASILIESYPHDKDYWWWRGIVYETKGELDKAAEDYRQALLIEPRLNGIPFNLANIYERMKMPCEGIAPIEQFIYFHPEARQEPNIIQRLAALYAREECVDMKGRGQTTIRFSPAAGAIIARATINGQECKLLLDTGASYVTISQALADKAKISPNPGREAEFFSASGIVKGRLATIKELAIDKLKSKRIPAVIVHEMSGEIDGLLGLSFLTRFKLTVDHNKGVATLSAGS